MKPKIRILPIADLKLDDRNANKGTARGREMLEESLRKYGAGRSVLVDQKGRVIAGNKTIETARATGMKSIAVIETDGESLIAVQRIDLNLKTDAKARELAIADNRISQVDLDWNPEVLAGSEVDLSQFWNEKELDELLKGFALGGLKIFPSARQNPGQPHALCSWRARCSGRCLWAISVGSWEFCQRMKNYKEIGRMKGTATRKKSFETTL